MDPLFDHEKLDVYGVELGFVAWLAAFLDDASNWSAQHRRELIEQLDRASLSVLLRRRPSFSAVSRWSERNSRPRWFLPSSFYPTSILRPSCRDFQIAIEGRPGETF